MNRLTITLAVAALLAAVGAQKLTAQNLLTNPHFDSGLSGWGIFPSAFDGTLDVNGSPTSGSLKWINDNTSPSSASGGPDQCVDGIVPLASYHLSVQVFVSPGQAFTGSGNACIAWFSGSCPMLTDFLSEACTPFAGAVGSWTPTELITTAPAGATSGIFIFEVLKVEAGGSLQANFDDAVFERLPASPTITVQASPTVPVGGVISDTAILAAGASPTGTMTFNLFGPADASCSGSPIFTSTKTITGNSSYTSDPFTALATGIYRWVASYGGDANNNATGPTSCADPAQAVFVGATVDLGISLDDGVSTATPGGTVIYTIVASNAGPDTDPAVIVTDTFPPSLSGCSVTSVAADGATGNDPGPTAGNLSDSGISLPPDSSVTYTATCTLGTSPGPTLVNTATAMGSVHDPNATNNSATDTDAVGASLAATKTASRPPYFVGGTVTYTIVLTNGGGDQPDNPGPELVDLLPSGLALVSASASSGTLTGVNNNSVFWNGSVPAGGTVTITIQATILLGAAGQTVANQASIAFDANGDGTNEAAGLTDDPTVAGGQDATLIEVEQSVAQIPTLDPPGLALLLLALATAGLLSLRRRHGSR